MTYLEHLSVPGMVGRTARIFAARWCAFFQLAAAVSFLPMVILNTIMGALVLSLFAELMAKMARDKDNQEAQAQDVMDAVSESLVLVLVLILVQAILYTVITIAGHGAMTRVTAEHYLHASSNSSSNTSIQWWDCFQTGLSQFCSLFTAGILLVLGAVALFLIPALLLSTPGQTVLGILMGILAPFIYIYVRVRLSLVYPVIIVEQASAMQAIQRSYALSSGAFCDIWCATLILSVANGVTMWFVSGVMSGVFDGNKQDMFKFPGILLIILFVQIPSFVFCPCQAILQTVLYFNARIHKEGFTRDALARDLLGEDDNPLTTPLLLASSSEEDHDDHVGEIASSVPVATATATLVSIQEDEECAVTIMTNKDVFGKE